MSSEIVVTTATNTNGFITVNTADGNNFEMGTIDDIKAELDAIDSDPRNAVLALCGNWLWKEPVGDNMATNLNGKACTLNLRSNTPVSIR